MLPRRRSVLQLSKALLDHLDVPVICLGTMLDHEEIVAKIIEVVLNV